MDRGSALRRAGSVLTDSSSRERDRKDLAGSLQSEGVMQLQLALRVELERQTRQLEEILAKQAQSAMDKNAEHRQEVQGIAAAWQLVARTLGEQLQNVQKKGQESARRVEAALEKTLQESVEREAQRHQEVQSVSEAWQTLGRSIGDQLGSLQRLGGKLETGLQRLDSKMEEQPGSPCLERHETENLPGQPSDEEDFALEDLEGEKARVSPSRTMRFNRSQTEDNEQSFAEMQKEFGVRDKNLRAGTMVPADQKVFWLRRCCIQIVAHKRFEMLCSALVILCAATIGIEADYTIQHALDSQHPVFRGLDMAFNFLFALELFVRWVSEGFCPFLSCENPQFRWNWMDLGLVSSSVVEELGALLAAASFLEVSALRMLRMMRLVRVARIIRMLRFFSELRVMVNGIMGSAKPLLWAFVFLLILMFMVGVTFMQLAANYLSQAQAPGMMDENLLVYWGSLSRTMMTLYMAISGGVDWKDCVQPLQKVSEALEYMFATYVFFTLFCCLNIVTGIFVDNAKALKSADEDAMYFEALTERKRWIAEVKDLFMRLDASINGKFTIAEFKAQISNIKVQTLFRKLGINLDGVNAEELWSILDADDSGAIDEEEFARGLKYFQGPAQSIHMYRLTREHERLQEKVESVAEACQQILAQQISSPRSERPRGRQTTSPKNALEA